VCGRDKIFCMKYLLSKIKLQGVSKMLGQTSGDSDNKTGKHFTLIYVQNNLDFEVEPKNISTSAL
jgi:hypothetical protein